MKKGDILIGMLMLFAVISAIGTVITYLLYDLFNIGSYLFSIIFFAFAGFSAICLMFVGLIVMKTCL